MKAPIFCVRDTVAGVYMNPQISPAKAVFLRSARWAVNSPSDSLLFRAPEDAQIFQVGVFDDQTGIIEPMEPLFICNCIDLKDVSKQEGDNA